MAKLTGVMTALALAGGLALAQDSQQSSASDTKSAPKSQASSSTTTQPPVMAVNVQSWHGTLIDANCTAGGGSSASRDQSGESKKGASQPCPVTSSTMMFALQTSGGQVLKFDAVGNMRTAEELKNKKKWSKELSEGKAIHATIGGNMSGETVTVTSIH